MRRYVLYYLNNKNEVEDIVMGATNNDFAVMQEMQTIGAWIRGDTWIPPHRITAVTFMDREETKTA